MNAAQKLFFLQGGSQPASTVYNEVGIFILDSYSNYVPMLTGFLFTRNTSSSKVYSKSVTAQTKLNIVNSLRNFYNY